MKKFLPLALLASIPAYALDSAAAAEPAVETVGPVAIVAFLLLFAGCIGYYVWLTIQNDKKKKDDLRQVK